MWWRRVGGVAEIIFVLRWECCAAVCSGQVSVGVGRMVVGCDTLKSSLATWRLVKMLKVTGMNISPSLMRMGMSPSRGHWKSSYAADSTMRVRPL